MFNIAATIESISTRADGTISLRVGTQELSPEQEATIFRFRKQLGWFTFSPNTIQETDIPETQVEDNGKSPSQRLRAVLYLYYTQVMKGEKKNFDQWYRAWYERKIEEIKENLI